MTADHAHTPTDELVAKVRAIAIDLDGDYRNGSWNEGAAQLFDQMIAQVEAAAEQRGAEAALMCENEISWEHHDQTDDFPCTRCLKRAQQMIDDYRADRITDAIEQNDE